MKKLLLILIIPSLLIIFIFDFILSNSAKGTRKALDWLFRVGKGIDV